MKTENLKLLFAIGILFLLSQFNLSAESTLENLTVDCPTYCHNVIPVMPTGYCRSNLSDTGSHCSPVALFGFEYKNCTGTMEPINCEPV